MPSHNIRATLLTLELASGSFVPRPTTISSVSVAGRLLVEHALDARAGGLQQLRVDGEVAPEPHVYAGMSMRELVDFRGHVVLHMPGGEQHAGDRQNAPVAAFRQRLQSLANHRAGEFEEADFQVVVRQTRPQSVRKGQELAHGIGIAAAVAAHHDSGLGHRASRFE